MTVAKAPRNKLDDVDLMHYLDGEADDATAAAVADALGADEDARAKVLAMEQMGETVRASLELAADQVEPRLDAMWATIERRIQANGAHESAMAREAVPAREAVRDPARQQAPREGQLREQGAGLWASFVKWLDAHRGYFTTGAITALGAAVLVLLLRPPQVVYERAPLAAGERPVAVGTPPAPEGPIEGTMQAPAQVVPVSTPTTVEHLEVTEGAGSVFTIPGEDEEDVSTTVIWLDMDESDAEETL